MTGGGAGWVLQVSLKTLARDTFLCCWQGRQQLQVIL